MGAHPFRIGECPDFRVNGQGVDYLKTQSSGGWALSAGGPQPGKDRIMFSRIRLVWDGVQACAPTRPHFRDSATRSTITSTAVISMLQPGSHTPTSYDTR